MSPKGTIDVLVFAPHPDDGELAAGGFLLKMKGKGYRTAMVDLTRGELGTKGNPETRAKEAAEAAKQLGLYHRACLDLGDGHLSDSAQARQEIVSVIRQLCPRLIIAPSCLDEHPDHRAAFELVRSAFFLARLPKYETGQALHAPEQLWTYAIHRDLPELFVIDISEQFAAKRKALECYRSQFVNPELPEGYRYVGLSDYLAQIEMRNRLWGQRIGTRYGEAFSAVTPLRISDPLAP